MEWKMQQLTNAMRRDGRAGTPDVTARAKHLRRSGAKASGGFRWTKTAGTSGVPTVADVNG